MSIDELHSITFYCVPFDYTRCYMISSITQCISFHTFLRYELQKKNLSNRALFNFGPSLHVLVTILYMHVLVEHSKDPSAPPMMKMFLFTRTLANPHPQFLPSHSSQMFFPLLNIWFFP